MNFDNVLYEAALDRFISGNWSEARAKLSELKAESGPANFLMAYMDRHQDPPADFNGVIRLDKK